MTTVSRLMIEHIEASTAHVLKNSELQSLTDFAGELATLAGRSILPHFRTQVVVEDKSDRSYFDPVTIADKESESVMRSHIKRHHPQHGIYGEEHGYESGEIGLTWVLDPIDGTRSFITGVPLWGTLIALFDGVQPVIGVMDQPYLKERYIGNQSTTVCQQNGVESVLQTSRCNQLDDAILMATHPDIFETNAERRAFSRLDSQIRMVRYGGDCYAYCMLAAGYIDLVLEAGLEPYDIQALIPIIEGAGGVVSNWRGESAHAGGQVLAAANPELHSQALAVIKASAV